MIVVFEELMPLHRWLVRYYILRRAKVYFIRLHRGLKDDGWIKKMAEAGSIEKIRPDARLHAFDGLHYDKAFSNIDKIYDNIRHSQVMNKIMELYGTADIGLIFKKALNPKLARFYYLDTLFHQLDGRFGSAKIIFRPSLWLNELYQRTGCEAYDYIRFMALAKKAGAEYFGNRNIRFPIWLFLASYFNAFKRKLGTLSRIAGFCPLTLFIFARQYLKRGTISARRYKYAIMIVSPLRQFANRIQRVDFLIDGDKIRRDETLFISCGRLSVQNRRYMEANRLNYIEDADIYFKAADMRNVFKIYSAILKSIFSEDELVPDTATRALYLYLRWNGFADRVKLENLITHGDSGIQSIARNILLGKRGCRTHCYMDTNNLGFLYVKRGDGNMHLYNQYGFLYYDNLAVWNEAAVRYFSASHCAIRNYADLGCMWAEHSRLLGQDTADSNLLRDIRRHGYEKGMRLAAVFDSCYNDDRITDYKDGLRFLNDILRLLENFEDIFIVLKERLPRSYHKDVTNLHRDILSAHEKLEAQPRCYCIKRWENASEVISFSDLVISFPFSSPTFEALSARKKAFWHDPTDKFRQTPYDSARGLVTHNYAELSERVDSLTRISGRDYDLYLDTHVKGRIEKYLDGRAITRFRELVSGGAVTTGKDVYAEEKSRGYHTG